MKEQVKGYLLMFGVLAFCISSVSLLSSCGSACRQEQVKFTAGDILCRTLTGERVQVLRFMGGQMYETRNEKGDLHNLVTFELERCINERSYSSMGERRDFNPGGVGSTPTRASNAEDIGERFILERVR